MKNYLEVISYTHFQLDMGQKTAVQFSAWTRNILFTNRSEVNPADGIDDSALFRGKGGCSVKLISYSHLLPRRLHTTAAC
jgi:hypothetical protein